MPTASELVAKGFYGYAGWDDAGANADFNATGGAGKGGSRSSGMGNINVSKPAMPDFQSIYDTAVTAGTKDSLSALDTITKRRQAQELQKNEAISKIADNPYLSEATMTGRIAKLTDRYNADTQALTGQEMVEQNKITTAKADAQVKLGIAQNTYNIQNQDYQQQVSQINQYLSAGLLNDISEQEMAQIATTTGMSTEMVKSIITGSKAKNEVKPQLITIDDGQNQQIVAVDSNGTVINKQVLGPSQAKAGSGSGGGSSATQAKADEAMQVKFEKAIDSGIKQLQSGSSWGEVWNRIKTLFPDAPPELIDALLGPQWKQAGAYQNYVATKKGY